MAKSGSTFDVELFLRRYEAMDRALAAIPQTPPWPRTSPWWMGQIRKFFRALARGKVRRWVDRVGRRGGKSSTLCRIAVCFALWGPWSVPPGDTGVVSFVSVDKKEANARLVTIKALLDALGQSYEARTDEIEVPDRRLVFRVVTCSIRGTVGFTSVAIFADEMSRWEVKETAANPAREVMGTLRPTLATMPFGFEVCSSSPRTDDDYHAELFNGGDGEFQIVSQAPTWEANPTLSEDRTHGLEPDYRTWEREYKAIPSTAAQENWFGEALERSIMDAPHARIPGIDYVISIDPAFDKDRFGWAVTASITVGVDVETTRPIRSTVLFEAGDWVVDRSPSEMALKLRTEVVERYQPGHNVVYTDQHEGHSFKELAAQAGLTLLVVPWTGGSGESSKLTRFRRVRMAMFEGQYRVPPDEKLLKQFRSVRGVLTPTSERIEIKRTKEGHGDAVTAAILGGSIALSRSPNAVDGPGPKPGTREWHIQKRREERQKEIDRINRRNAQEWDQNPRRVMRRALGLS